MGKSIAQKIIAAHLVDGEMQPGAEVGLRIDQTLTQDATGTMAYLEFEAMGIPRVRTELSVAYIDHNTLQNGFENADDHIFIRSIAKRVGVRYSRPGNGICHQVHLERFAAPGKTLIGSDSHTPTAGGIGCLAIGAGGLDVAVAMGGGAYYGGLAQDFVDVSPLNQDTVAPGTDAAIQAVKAKIVSGEWDVFSGVKLHVTVNTDGTVSVDQADEALVDNAGNEIVAAGGPSVEDSVITGSMNYFVAGVEEA